MAGKKTARKARDPQKLEVIVKAESRYKDERGNIDYFVLPEPVNWVGVISSKKGAVRANHYHPKQQQKCLIISGSCVCVYKDLDSADSPVRHHLAKAGDLVITEPRVAHAVVYLEDTLFLNLVRGERNPANYGKHTLPYELVNEGNKGRFIKLYS